MTARFRVACIALPAAALFSATLLPAAGKPNIVLIVSDDQGYADASCYEHPDEVRTPHIDRLAARGVRFTNGYATGYVCAPTRAGLLTGRYQQRFGFYTAGDSRTGLPVGEITLADVLKARGYATGVFGKWHLGLEPPYRPLARGFGEFYGFLGHGGHDYFKLARTDEYTSIYRNDTIIDETGYLTDNLAREAVSFIERHQAGPFFLYLPFNAVHWPLQAPAEDRKRFHNADAGRNTYLAMLHRMDLAVGRVLDALDRHDLSENTLVFFLSDNGGARKNLANNGALRDFKHSVYEGGVRVPFLVSWPGHAPRGAVIDTPVICLDIFPTACAAAGATLPGDRVIDGKSLLPLLKGTQDGPLHEAIFWDGDEEKRAVRMGRWKLVDNKGAVALFDLDKDTGETTDLAKRRPEMVEKLRSAFQAWRAEMKPRIVRKRPAGKGPTAGGSREEKRRKRREARRRQQQREKDENQ